MKKMKLFVITILSMAIFGVLVTNQPSKKAHASILSNVASATYVYHNRNELKQLYHKGQNTAKTNGMPKFHVVKRGKAKDLIVVQTKKKTYKIGWFSKKLINGFFKYRNLIKNSFQSKYHKLV